MNRIQQLAAYVPYMTCPGNHGEWCVCVGGTRGVCLCICVHAMITAHLHRECKQL